MDDGGPAQSHPDVEAVDHPATPRGLDKPHFSLEVVRVVVGLVQHHDDLAVVRPVLQDRDQTVFHLGRVSHNGNDD